MEAPFYDRAIYPTAGGRWEDGGLVVLTPEFLPPRGGEPPVSHALFLEDRVTKPVERVLVGILGRPVSVRFEVKS